MDGNGRWAKKRHLPKIVGHREGVKRVEEIVKVSTKMGVKVLTLFAFSTENWDRPKEEVSILMELLVSFLNKKIKSLYKNNIKLTFIGREQGVPKVVSNVIHSATELTRNNTGMILNVAFNYGSRLEILDAVAKIATEVKNGRMEISDINEKIFDQALYTKGLVDPDLMIRTSGEKRVSNFLLWQLSYAEFYFSDKYWPDFGETEFKKALLDFNQRQRRYGNVISEIVN